MKSLAGQYFKAVSDELLILAEGGSFKYPVTAILVIIEQRVFEPSEVDPYLMSPSGLKLAFND